MIPLAIGVGIMALLIWLAGRYERPLLAMLKRLERSDRVRLNESAQKEIIEGCDLMMEIHPDPQCDAHRIARDLKLRLEKKARK